MEGGAGGKNNEAVDGSEIMKLVENEAVFSRFVEDKFQKLDLDKDGKLSLTELRPAVADLGAALGLPAQGSSPDSDQIYSQVLDEFTHGKEDKVSKTEFKEVLSDFLIGMAAGLKRDPILILRIDGEDLREFVNGPAFDAEMASIFSHIHSPNTPLRDNILNALHELGVDQGLPPTSDPWVMSNIVEPALQTISNQQAFVCDEDVFFAEFKKAAESIADRLKEQPVIVAHTENTFEGSGIRRLLANNFELEKVLNTAIGSLPRDRHGKMSKEYLRVALDSMASSAGLPPYGAIEEMDKVTNNALKMLEVDDGMLVKEDEMKKLLKEILGIIMLQLEGNPISVSSDSVVHEHLDSPQSSLLQPPTPTSSNLN